MKSPEYNLLDEPWIPARLLDGSVIEVGLLELLRRANEITDLACEVPTQSIAIQRLILAVAYRVAAPADEDEWIEQFDEGLPAAVMVSYLERWRDRFFLFGGRYPFMQVVDLRTEKDEVKPLDAVVACVPKEEKRLFSTRQGPAVARLSPADAARWLVHAQAYDPSGTRTGAVGDEKVKKGKGYPIGPSWCGQLGLVWLKGKNLNETLVLNLVPVDAGELIGVDDFSAWSTCSWEDAEPENSTRGDFSLLGSAGTPKELSIPRLLTWHSRRIRLMGEVASRIVV